MKTSKIAPLALLIPAVVLAQPAPMPPAQTVMPPPGTMKAPPFNPVNPVNPVNRAKAADALKNAKEREGDLNKSVGYCDDTLCGSNDAACTCSYLMPFN
jgi:hypothetical protein